MMEEQVNTAVDMATNTMSFEDFRSAVLADFRLAVLSRECSLIGRKEVLTGKAKFGIFGDGKELAQLAMARQFRNGDFRSGYYRDQTFMMAIGALTPQQYFASLYAHTDLDHEPSSAGRQMNGHFATHSLNEDGTWKRLTDQKNSSADISPTAGQMSRLLGLAQASKVYRHHGGLADRTQFSISGNEVAFGTIGDASTSEGPFWETLNAAGVLQVPLAMSVWDDGYGISVSRDHQTIKGNISEALSGFQRTEERPGYEIFRVKGWDYPSLCDTYERAIALCREQHVPVLIHVTEVTQPQGHSTSGSHERYKSKERLQWEADFDGIVQFRKWILESEANGQKLATAEELDAIDKEARTAAREARAAAWKAFIEPIVAEQQAAAELLTALAGVSAQGAAIGALAAELKANREPIRKDVISTMRRALHLSRGESSAERERLKQTLAAWQKLNYNRYSSHLLSETERSPMNLPQVAPQYADTPEEVDGRVILRDNADVLFERYPEVLIFGEDVGKIGGVNQTMEGMQAKYGELRVSDTGIRENTIIGQGIGMAMRGLRPIAEIQYLDYLLYALQVMSDDLATVRYRSMGRQMAPLIVSTRGHRLEGIWHSGSPMGMILHSLRGMHVCVPRNMTKAAGFYNLLLQGDDPALVVEPLNGYRSKEYKPVNLGDFTTPLGVPEITREGAHITLVSYGSTFNLCSVAANQLAAMGVEVELVDVQTLLPFDIHHVIAGSLQKTNRLMVVDEDVSFGAASYILNRILEEQGGYFHLDAAPVTLTSKDHRPAYGSDGDYFSKPSVEDIVETAYGIMHEADPTAFPAI
jgi:pyruvate/2-oxoglutarate/acetoin dehydrogenase E1 component/TPP-dependent pyruvate/acetoin dehydrogenase alpha subunit